MVDLERQIVNWRNELSASEAILLENVEELEDHLRSTITTLMEKDLSAEEAFLVATRRIGASGKLSEEFGKVNGPSIWIQRFRWMLLGALLFQTINGIWSLIAEGISWTTLIYSSSPLVSGVLFTLISACLPIGIWFVIRSTVKKEIDLQHYLNPFIQFVLQKPKIAFSLFVGLLVFVPITSFMMQVFTARAVPIESVGELQYAVVIYQFVAGFLIPILGVALLAWLNRQTDRSYPG